VKKSISLEIAQHIQLTVVDGMPTLLVKDTYEEAQEQEAWQAVAEGDEVFEVLDELRRFAELHGRRQAKAAATPAPPSGTGGADDLGVARVRRDLRALVKGWLVGVENLRAFKTPDADGQAARLEKAVWALQHILGERIAAGGLTALGAIYGEEWGDGTPDPSMPPAGQPRS
jgi:hypothetical protein